MIDIAMQIGSGYDCRKAEDTTTWTREVESRLEQRSRATPPQGRRP